MPMPMLMPLIECVLEVVDKNYSLRPELTESFVHFIHIKKTG